MLLSIEAIRPDRLPAYGGKDPLPAFAKLAASAVVFDDAATVVPMARPAAATLLTGRTPDRIAMRDDLSDRLPDDVRTVAEAARAAGSRTGAFVSTPFCAMGAGFERGFELFDAPEETSVGPLAFEPRQRASTEVADHATAWIRALPTEQRFFAWVHLGTLHGRGVGKDDASADLDYAEGLRQVDGALASLAEALENRKVPVDLIVVGTHGTHLGEQGRRGAAFWLTPETLRVPLLWRGSGLAPRRESRKAWLPDVAATVAERAGWSLPAGDGASLFGAAADPRERRAWSWAPDDQIAWATLAAVERDGVWVEDPARPATPRTRVLSEATRQALAAAGTPLQSPGGERRPADDVTRTDVLVRVQRVRSHIAGQRDLMAMKQGRRLQEEHPKNLGALLPWTFMAAVGRDPDRAKDAVQTLLRDFSDRGEALHAVAHLRWFDDRGKAETLLQAAWELGPQEPEILYDLACARSLAGDAEGAVARLREAVARGYRDWTHLEADLDLANARKSPAYAELMRAHGR
ncbi:MAG TPA: sulfatase-like hydrolase/transferase [Candidatus Polarisedimenticolaceae bacterium]|nr:sulfatase-like hydrolase/transferase [Candidatus Polarisedimenticolaceae bacterium]